MKKTILLLFSIFLLQANTNCPLFGQQHNQEKPARILFLIDASSSMTLAWTEEESRFGAASRIVSAICDSIYRINPEVTFGVRVFGSQYPSQEKNCFDSRIEVKFSYANFDQIRRRLSYIKPIGYSPIAWSLRQAAEKDFTESEKYAYSIILITDGGESCGGDICYTVESLLNRKISFKPYILSLAEFELKSEYDCLGEFIKIEEEKDIAIAISEILKDNKQVLSVQTVGMKPIKIDETSVQSEKKTAPSQPKQVEIKEVPLQVAPPQTPVNNTQKAQPIQSIKMEERKPLKEQKRIRYRTAAGRMNILYTLPDPRARVVPKLKLKNTLPFPEAEEPVLKPASIKYEPISKPISTSTTTTAKVERKEPIVTTYTIKQEPAKTTTVKVYFVEKGTNRRFNTEPQLVFTDVSNQKDAKKVHRNVMGSEPRPIDIEPGVYDITIPGSMARVANVEIKPNMENIVTISVGRASLAFHYPTALDRPVKEYTARVSQRFSADRSVTQHPCDQRLEYEPTNYHIEINTLPPLVYNIDLAFDFVHIVAIPEPGRLKIENRERIGQVQLWHKRGDAYVDFYNMQINGNAAMQQVDLRPGQYEVRYFKGPQGLQSKVEVVKFQIQSNTATIVHLEI